MRTFVVAMLIASSSAIRINQVANAPLPACTGAAGEIAGTTCTAGLIQKTTRPACIGATIDTPNQRCWVPSNSTAGFPNEHAVKTAPAPAAAAAAPAKAASKFAQSTLPSCEGRYGEVPGTNCTSRDSLIQTRPGCIGASLDTANQRCWVPSNSTAGTPNEHAVGGPATAAAAPTATAKAAKQKAAPAGKTAPASTAAADAPAAPEKAAAKTLSQTLPPCVGAKGEKLGDNCSQATIAGLGQTLPHCVGASLDSSNQNCQWPQSAALGQQKTLPHCVGASLDSSNQNCQWPQSAALVQLPTCKGMIGETPGENCTALADYN